MRLVKLLTLVAVLAALPPGARAGDCGGEAADADGDGICDAVDPCEGISIGSRLREVAIKLRKLGVRPNDDTLRFEAIVPLRADETIDPAATGLRLTLLHDASTHLVLSVAAPAGAGWKVNADGWSWSYRSPDVGTSEIKRALVREIEPNPAYVVPRALLVRIDARRGTYEPTSDLESHYVELGFAETGTAEVCAQLLFYPWLFTGLPGVDPWEAEEWQQSCRFRSNGRTLDCGTGPRVGPCRVSWPGDMMTCDAENAAAAQEQYWNVNGSYYSGTCDGLPGFVPTPNVACTTSGTQTAFTVSTLHLYDVAAYFGCTWTSSASPHLYCN